MKRSELHSEGPENNSGLRIRDTNRVRDRGRDRGSDSDQGPRQRPSRSGEVTLTVAVHPFLGCSSRQVIARTSSKSLRAVSALRPSTAPA
jgi:hypothetical protein